MSNKRYKCLLISDFTVDNFTGLLTNNQDLPLVETFTAPFGQVLPVLLNGNHECWKNEYDFAVVWTQPQAVVKSFNDLLNYKRVDSKEVLAQVDEYMSALSNISDKVRFVFMPSWIVPSYNRGFGMLEMKPSTGITAMLMQMNLRLSEYFESASNIFVLDVQKWIAQVGPRAVNPKLWYMGKIPFSNDVFLEAVKDIKAAINGITGRAKKLIIVDLDHTLWGGIVGDEGWENLRLGGHDAIGEAFIDFQRVLKAFSNRGVLLAIVSKNEESVALEAIEKHPEMVLRPNDFAGWKINWNDKAQNVIDLAKELNVGLQSVVFLDDDPSERGRVREALPEVFVPQLPQDKMLYASALLGLRCFDIPSLSQEDINRTAMYISERKRKGLQNTVGSIDDWLRSLHIKITVEKLNQLNIKRTSQLLNKTNQMNLSTRRLTDVELVEWEKQVNHWLRIFRVSDKFGDSGLTGIISLEIDKTKCRIVDFVLSCRVMGRKVEETMVRQVYEYAKSLDLDEIEAEYKPTSRNKPCFDFWKRSGFEYDQESKRFTWSMKKEYPLHDYALMEIAE